MLFNYVKIADGIFTESDCATVRDEICLRIDQSQFTADEAEDYINQEVEKRIAERMPSEDEIEQWMQENRWASARQYVKWLRSRLTCSEKPNNSQKTEEIKEKKKFKCYEIWRPNIPDNGCKEQCKECAEREKTEGGEG